MKPGPAKAAGRYRHIYSALWSRRDFQALTPSARLVYLNLRTGTQSNLAGIGYVYREAIEQETGLDGGSLEGALGELEKMPTPSRSWIVREGTIVWVRDHLSDSPARESDPNVTNSKHRAAIGYILGSLPSGSPIVKKFRRYYNFGTDRVSHGPSRRGSHAPSHSPEIGDRRTEKEIGEGESERENQGGVPAPLAPPQTPPVFKIFNLLLREGTAGTTPPRSCRCSTKSWRFSKIETSLYLRPPSSAKPSASSRSSVSASRARAGLTCSRL